MIRATIYQSTTGLERDVILPNIPRIGEDISIRTKTHETMGGIVTNVKYVINDVGNGNTSIIISIK